MVFAIGAPAVILIVVFAIVPVIVVAGIVGSSRADRGSPNVEPPPATTDPDPAADEPTS